MEEEQEWVYTSQLHRPTLSPIYGEAANLRFLRGARLYLLLCVECSYLEPVTEDEFGIFASRQQPDPRNDAENSASASSISYALLMPTPVAVCLPQDDFSYYRVSDL